MRLIATVALLTLFACRGGQPRDAVRSEATTRDLRVTLAASAKDTTLRLIAFAPTDTVRDPDSLRVVVAIWNGGDYRELGDTFYSFSYDIIDASGAPLRPAPLPEVYGIRNNFRLGRGEFAGFTEPLACSRQTTEPRQGCWWDFHLTDPGTYRIVVHYRTTPPPDVTAPVAGRDYLALDSDTIHVEFRPRPGH